MKKFLAFLYICRRMEMLGIILGVLGLTAIAGLVIWLIFRKIEHE